MIESCTQSGKKIGTRRPAPEGLPYCCHKLSSLNSQPLRYSSNRFSGAIHSGDSLVRQRTRFAHPYIVENEYSSIAASGQGDLAVIYIDEAKGDELSLRALFTCRTEDWHFIKTVLFYFLRMLRSVKAAGDETGLGKQICWEAASYYGGVFSKVNFSGKKHDLGFALMNQLHTAQKRFPKSQQDIAADYFALRKEYSGTRWAFSEGRNALNPASHCDIAWAGALASHAHTQSKCSIGCAVLMEDGTVLHSDRDFKSAEQNLLWSDDPRIWRPIR